MLFSQVLIVFHTIRHNSGETIEGLANIIYKKYGDMDEVKFMMSGNKDYELLKSRIKEINSVVSSEERYYYDSNIRPHSKDNILSYFLQYQLDAESARLKKELSQKLDGD